MSSFGESKKTIIEESLSWIAREYYSNNFDEDKEVQRQFLLDTLDVLRYICGEWGWWNNMRLIKEYLSDYNTPSMEFKNNETIKS